MNGLTRIHVAFFHQPLGLVHDQDRVVDHRAHKNQEAQHRDHVKRLVKRVQPDQGQCGTDRIHENHAHDAACDAQRYRRHDQQWVSPVAEYRDQ